MVVPRNLYTPVNKPPNVIYLIDSEKGEELAVVEAELTPYGVDEPWQAFAPKIMRMLEPHVPPELLGAVASRVAEYAYACWVIHILYIGDNILVINPCEKRQTLIKRSGEAIELEYNPSNVIEASVVVKLNHLPDCGGAPNCFTAMLDSPRNEVGITYAPRGARSIALLIAANEARGHLAFSGEFKAMVDPSLGILIDYAPREVLYLDFKGVVGERVEKLCGRNRECRYALLAWFLDKVCVAEEREGQAATTCYPPNVEALEKAREIGDDFATWWLRNRDKYAAVCITYSNGERICIDREKLAKTPIKTQYPTPIGIRLVPKMQEQNKGFEYLTQ